MCDFLWILCTKRRGKNKYKDLSAAIPDPSLVVFGPLGHHGFLSIYLFGLHAMADLPNRRSHYSREELIEHGHGRIFGETFARLPLPPSMSL
jgi:hypothetical protein